MALWNILQHQGLRSNVIGWWPSHPVEPIDGVMVFNHYHSAPSVDADKPWPLSPGTVHPPRLARELRRLRFHPTELMPEHILPFAPKAADIDQEKDHRLSALAKTLAECISVNAAATAVIQNEPRDLSAVYLDAIDHFSHGFMRYHPPRQAWVKERDFELYQGVVAGAYSNSQCAADCRRNRSHPDLRWGKERGAASKFHPMITQDERARSQSAVYG